MTLAPLLPGSVFVNAERSQNSAGPTTRPRMPTRPRGGRTTRARLIELGQSFIAETVFSHPSKLELIDTAHAADYTVVLHVLFIPEELAVRRVRHRVRAGGHDVPEHKIRERYQRLWALVAAAITRSDSATVYDSSALKGPRIVAQITAVDYRLPGLAGVDPTGAVLTVARVASEQLCQTTDLASFRLRGRTA